MIDEMALKPALTAEEWDRERAQPSAFEFWVEDNPGGLLGDDHWRVTEDHRHAIAAVALYGQPYGFTMQDVAALIIASEETHDASLREKLDGIAIRIAALIPLT